MSKRSVVSIHSGQAGIQIGSSVWELYNFEHDIDNTGARNLPDPSSLGTDIDNFRTFYYETASGRYVPKALFIDSEPSVMDALRLSTLGKLIHSNFMVNSSQDCRNMMGLAWNKEYCGDKFHNVINEQIRKLREVCDTLSGTTYYLSTCGGAGTGFTCRALEQMRNIDPKSVNYAICQCPSPTINSNPLETFNTVAYMGFTRFDNLFMNMHTIYDNEALYRQCRRLYGSTFSPTYKHLNQLIAMSMSSCTASLRFDGQLNVDLNEFQTNLVPIPTLNLMFSTMSPLDMDEDKEVMSTRDITMQSFLPEAMMCSVDPFAWPNKWPVEEGLETWPLPPWTNEAEDTRKQLMEGAVALREDQYAISHKFLACCVMYRGDLMPATINRAMQELTLTKQPQFAPWVPSGFKVGINSPPMRTPTAWPIKDMSRFLSCLVNNTAIEEKLKQLVRNHRMITEMNGYECWTETGGISTDILDACKQGICDQISQYDYCMATRIDIDEIKGKLDERPSSIGNI